MPSFNLRKNEEKRSVESYDLQDEHLYEFCMDNRMYSEYTYQSDPEGDEPSADITLDEVGLCKGQKFALHYDFGDDWIDIVNITLHFFLKDVRSMLPPAVNHSIAVS